MKDILDIKNSILKKQINSYEEISKINNEIGNLAKDNTVGNAVKTLSKIETLFKQFNLNGTNELIKNLNNIDELKRQGEELVKINKYLNLIAKKNPEIKINDLIKWPSKPSEAIPVVLTDKFKEEFYDALKSLPVYFGGGGGNVDTSKLATSKLQQDIIEAINNIEINADSINLNTDDLEEKLDTIIDENKDGSQKTQIVETVPTDTTKFNASTLISYNANDEAVYIDETFDGVTYRTTFTRSDMTVASTLPISAVTIL